MTRTMLALAAAATAGLAISHAQPPAYPDTPDGLKRLLTDLYAAHRDGQKDKAAALGKGLVLPKHDAWFAKTFGPEHGKAAAAAYAKVLPDYEVEIDQLFAKLVKDGRSEVAVLKFDRAADPKAVGNQKDALAAMKAPTPLYSARFTRPGADLGNHLYSFVYADGGFRLIGRVPPPAGK